MSSLGDLAALATTSLSFGIDRILSKTLGEAGPAQRPAAVNVGTRGGGETPKDGRARDEGHGTDAPVNRDDGPELVLKSQNSMRTWTHGSDERKSEGSTPGEDDVSVPESWNRRLVTDSNSENARGTRRCADKFSDTTLSRVSPKTMEFCSHLKSEHFTTTPTYPLSHYAYIRCVGDQDVEGRLSGYGVDWLGPCLMSPGVDSCCSLHAGGAASRPPLLRAAGPQPCPQRVTPVRKLHFPASSLSPWTRQPPSWIDVRRERVSLVLRGPLFEKSQAKRKKPRTSFTRVQIVELEKRFHRQKYLSSAERSSVAKTLKMTDGQVKTWFQNRRTKWRRQTAEERDAEREAASRLILSLQTDKSQCLDVTDSVCLRNSSLHALQNLRPWKDEGKTGESDTEPQAVERGGKDRRE